MSLDVSRFNQWDLLRIAEAANPPDEHQDQSFCGDETFSSCDGWQVVFFYDMGELDYIDHFVTPTGYKIEFWDWPEPERELLTSWRGVGDLERFRLAPN